MTKREVMERVRGLSQEERNQVVCALVGHSRIQTSFFGYYYCGRCNAQVGDSLGSIYPSAAAVVVVGHNCETCRANAKTLTWRDKLFAPDPFVATVEG
jgi:hypothetical protein